MSLWKYVYFDNEGYGHLKRSNKTSQELAQLDQVAAKIVPRSEAALHIITCTNWGFIWWENILVFIFQGLCRSVQVSI